MIERYADDLISDIWSDLTKYKLWLNVELAIIAARDRCQNNGEISTSSYNIRAKLEITNKTVLEIADIEERTHHDLASFVDAVRNQLPDDLKKYFHSGGVTSYDIEEPALAITMHDSLTHVIHTADDLSRELERKAVKYKKLLMVAHTHSQHAQPYTLGIKLLGYYDDVRRSQNKLKEILKDLKFSKISGAVGMYGDGLTPEIEKDALNILGLKPADFSRQIILRDTIARVLSEIAILGSVLEKIATDFRLASGTERRELQEPFLKTQKGSSVMPFKKNPITWEKVCGLARLLRSNLKVAIENVGTWDERDISHSSVERIILPDSFHLICHMLNCMTKTVKNLVVNEDQIKKNLESTLPMLLSPAIATILIERMGKGPEETYRILQEAAFEFMNSTDADFFDLIVKKPSLNNSISKEFLESVKRNHFESLFCFVEQIFDRNIIEPNTFDMLGIPRAKHW